MSTSSPRSLAAMQEQTSRKYESLRPFTTTDDYRNEDLDAQRIYMGPQHVCPLRRAGILQYPPEAVRARRPTYTVTGDPAADEVFAERSFPGLTPPPGFEPPAQNYQWSSTVLSLVNFYATVRVQAYTEGMSLGAVLGVLLRFQIRAKHVWLPKIVQIYNQGSGLSLTRGECTAESEKTLMKECRWWFIPIFAVNHFFAVVYDQLSLTWWIFNSLPGGKDLTLEKHLKRVSGESSLAQGGSRRPIRFEYPAWPTQQQDWTCALWVLEAARVFFFESEIYTARQRVIEWQLGTCWKNFDKNDAYVEQVMVFQWLRATSVILRLSNISNASHVPCKPGILWTPQLRVLGGQEVLPEQFSLRPKKKPNSNRIREIRADEEGKTTDRELMHLSHPGRRGSFGFSLSFPGQRAITAPEPVIPSIELSSTPEPFRTKASLTPSPANRRSASVATPSGVSQMSPMHASTPSHKSASPRSLSSLPSRMSWEPTPTPGPNRNLSRPGSQAPSGRSSRSGSNAMSAMDVGSLHSSIKEIEEALPLSDQDRELINRYIMPPPRALQQLYSDYERPTSPGNPIWEMRLAPGKTVLPATSDFRGWAEIKKAAEEEKAAALMAQRQQQASSREARARRRNRE